MSRPAPDLCEVCGVVPPTHGLGFPANPAALPGLPFNLRAGCVWICAAPSCAATATARAITAAAGARINLKKIWRHMIIRPPQTQLKRTT